MTVPQAQGAVVTLETRQVGCQTLEKGSWSANEMEKSRLLIMLVMKNNNFLNSYFGQRSGWKVVM